MKRVFKALAVFIGAVSCFGLASCDNNNNTGATINKVESDTLYVNKVENLSDDFIMGMDASAVPSLEASGVKYYDFNGEETDVFKVLADNGINYIRVRVWNDPYDAEGNGYGGGNCDIENCIEIGKRATKYGMKLLVNFHYSDFWADPSKQMVPKAWTDFESMDKTQLSERTESPKAVALYEYTAECLKMLKDAGVDVGMVQIGNETNAFICGENKWANIQALFKAGAKAVREVFPEALVALHFANPEKTSNYLDYAKKLNYYGVDYDVFGSSYYPYWHGTLDNLSYILSTIAETYNKKTMVMETSYAWTTTDTDGWANTISNSGYDSKPYPFTLAGQTNCIRDIIDTVANKTTNGIGVCYWEGTWISVGSNDSSVNSEKWEKYGSGWASSYAAEYDSKDAGKWYGGCAVDNQAFFDSTGHPIETLKLWALVRTGNECEKYVDGVLDSDEIVYTYETDYKLPSKVKVVFSDNSTVESDVTWEEFDIAKALALGNAKYKIAGMASNYTVYCNLTVMEFNFVDNYSFENGMTSWSMTNNGGDLSDTRKIQITNENPQTGTYAYHFWTSNSAGVNFDLEQKLTLSTTGTYKFQASFLGGGSGSSAITASAENVYLYVKINGEIIYTKNYTITCWDDGFGDCLLEGIEYTAGDEIICGIHIEISEANCWGDIDDVMFNYVG